MSKDNDRNEFRLGAKPLIAALLGTACGASPLPYNVLPFIIGPIHQEFGWDFKWILLGITIFGVIASSLSPVFGAISDKIGVRKVALTSLSLFVLVFASFFFVSDSLPIYYGLWALLGLIGIGSTPLTWSRAVNLWFVKNKGLALGIMLVGTSITGIVVPQIAKYVIENFGWRFSFPALALLPLLIALPIGFLWFREPRLEERPQAVVSNSGELLGLSLTEAMRDYRFWLLVCSVSIVTLAYGGAHINMAEIVKLHGHKAATANVMGVLALGILSGRLIVGFLFDKFYAPVMACLALFIPALGCIFLIGNSTDLTLIMIGAFLLGFTAGTESDVLAFFAAKYFGMKNYGKIYGALYMAFGLSAAVSPFIYGSFRDIYGNYDLALTIAIGLFSIGALLLLGLGKYPSFKKD